MLPIGPLMIEHRLIERMIALLSVEAKKIRAGEPPDAEFVRVAVDFIKTYADQLHHGKEEALLFRALAKKPLTAEYQALMDELISEHIQGRETVRRLVAARDRYLQGEKGAAADLAQPMETLADFYPRHIAKEDKRFFIPVMDYFSPAEQADMLQAFNEFDRKFIHGKYREVVSALDGKQAPPWR